MASRIAGITVEIGGDTTKLSKALEGVNKTIKTTQSELKDVNKLLKLDPSNTETVTQKQRMLKDAIEATKEKLTTLKTAAEQANQQLADGKITQDQYDALQREIVETEQNLKSLQEQAAVTNTTLAKINAVGEKLQTVGSQVEGVGKKFLPVTAAVTGLGTAAVKTAADFDQEMSKVAAISGATGSDFDSLREKAREMGAKTKFSASEAASAMEYMAMAGWKTGDMLDGIEGIMNLGAVTSAPRWRPVFVRRQARSSGPQRTWQAKSEVCCTSLCLTLALCRARVVCDTATTFDGQHIRVYLVEGAYTEQQMRSWAEYSELLQVKVDADQRVQVLSDREDARWISTHNGLENILTVSDRARMNNMVKTIDSVVRSNAGDVSATATALGVLDGAGIIVNGLMSSELNATILRMGIPSTPCRPESRTRMAAM